MYVSVTKHHEVDFSEINVNVTPDLSGRFHVGGGIFFSLTESEMSEFHKLLTEILENPTAKRFTKD